MATSTRGSGFLSKFVRDHLLTGRSSPGSGLRGSLTRLVNILEGQMGPLAAFRVEEWTNPVAADVDAWLTAQATTTSIQTYTADDMDGASAGSDLDVPRNVGVTTVGADDQFNFPLTVEITGTYLGVAQTETVTFGSGDSPGTLYTSKPFSRVTGVVISANADVSGTVSVGTGIGLAPSKIAYPKSRAGLVTILMEIAAGSKVTNGTLNAYGVYTPNSAPDGSRDYTIYFEDDVSSVARLAASQRPLHRAKKEGVLGGLEVGDPPEVEPLQERELLRGRRDQEPAHLPVEVGAEQGHALVLHGHHPFCRERKKSSMSRGSRTFNPSSILRAWMRFPLERTASFISSVTRRVDAEMISSGSAPTCSQNWDRRVHEPSGRRTLTFLVRSGFLLPGEDRTIPSPYACRRCSSG